MKVLRRVARAVEAQVQAPNCCLISGLVVLDRDLDVFFSRREFYGSKFARFEEEFGDEDGRKSIIKMLIICFAVLEYFLTVLR